MLSRATPTHEYGVSEIVQQAWQLLGDVHLITQQMPDDLWLNFSRRQQNTASASWLALAL